jgi:hypothetical protein
MDPRALFGNLDKSKTFPVIRDSGASLSLSFDKNDFVGPVTKPPDRYKLRGIANGLKIEGVGHIIYSVRDSTGMLRSVKTPGIYCPNATVRLISTTALLNE